MPEKQKPRGAIEFTINNAIALEPNDFFPVEFGDPKTFYIERGKKYLPFIGRRNNLPSLLLEARLTSVTQNACITSIANATIGNGLKFVENESPDKGLIEWMKSVNNYRKSFDKEMLNTIDGERTQGNQFIEICRGTVGGKKYLKVYNHSVVYTRLAEPDEKDGFIKSVYISKEFAKGGTISKNKLIEIPLWSPDALNPNEVWKKGEDGWERTMLHFKNEVSGIDYYGWPASYPGLKFQVLESKYAQANLDNLDNNMILGGMLVFKSSMSAEEAEDNAKKILFSHVGEGKTGRIAVVSSESGLADVEFIPYSTTREGSYLDTDKRNEQKIILANGWDAILAGLSRDSSFGTGSDYIRSIWDLKETMLLQPLRKKLIDEVITPIMQIYSEWFKVKEIANYKFEYDSAMPFSFMADIKPEWFMKIDEMRRAAKLEADNSLANKYLWEVKTTNNNVSTQSTPAQNIDSNG